MGQAAGSIQNGLMNLEKESVTVTAPTTLSLPQVLFVDDEVNILHAFRRLFQDEPFEILTAESGKAALQLLNNDRSVAVIVSDQRMPEMTGAEFLEQSRALVPDAIRIVLTGYADINTAVDAINKGGAYRYISKPWNDVELIAVIREAASRFALVQENKRLTEIVHRQNAELKQWSLQLEQDVQQQTIEIQRANDQLLLAYDATIEGWSRALDLRDKETQGHSRRVTDMTEKIARAMGVGKAELVHVRRGALLHDIGKLGVPDHILFKPGRLTDEEWVLMRKHPVFAYDLLFPIEFLHPAIAIPYCHHEKWDGTGYPQGLKGGQIPLAARIFAIVDVWDALSSDRPYRPAWAQEKVLAYLREQAEIQFDPDIVAICIALFEKP